MMSGGETPRASAVHDMPKEGENAPDWCHPAKLFIGGLPRETSTQQLRDHFSKHGRVVDCVVMRWSDGRSRGFGYITFDNNDSATEALKMTQSIGGRLVDVKRAVPGTNKLFVGGLAQGVTAAELRTYFATFGPVSDAVVMMDSTTGRSRGFGFVCFAPGPDGATAISAALANYDKNQLRGKWIEVKSAAPPQELSKAAETAPIEGTMPLPAAPGLSSTMPPSMSISALQAHYHAAAAAQQAYNVAHASATAHCMVQGGLVPPLMTTPLPHHFLLPHSAAMSADAPEFVPDFAPVQPASQLLPGGRPPASPMSKQAERHVQVAPDKEAEDATTEKKKRSRGRGWSKNNKEETTSAEMATLLGNSNISPTSLAARPPPGLTLDETPARFPSAALLDPELPVYIEVPQSSEVKEMSCQTDGPACISCGAAFGCGGKCGFSRNQLLGLRQMIQKADTTVSSLKTQCLEVTHEKESRKATSGGA